MELDRKGSTMRNKQLLNEYYLWLLGIVDGCGYSVDDYHEMLWQLFDTDFTWIIAMDENRALDGLNLRYEYHHVYGGEIDREIEEKAVSVLEVLIALAINWEHEITYDGRIGDRSAVWFWWMLRNLGLTEQPDWAYDPDFVGDTVEIWLSRQFSKTGDGSPFPVKTGGRDQRKVEIWFQLQQFVLENVEI